jgi:hypothetical protein
MLTEITTNGSLKRAGTITGKIETGYAILDRRTGVRFTIDDEDVVPMTYEQVVAYMAAIPHHMNYQEVRKRSLEVQSTWKIENRHRALHYRATPLRLSKV